MNKTWKNFYVLTLIEFCLVTPVCDARELQAAMSSRLADLSLEELIDIDITSVSKRLEKLSDAAAAVYVITDEDIRRMGARSIPEALRLAPNLEVAKVDANRYAISARGFNSTIANKLLVLIDGRSVYTPLFSGVFWDVQDTFMEDIERIEVISGPGSTLWGANAVNGVINIITRNAKQTVGGLATASVGTDAREQGIRYGKMLNENTAFRLYAKHFDRDNTFFENGNTASDAWENSQVGFRIDWSRGSEALSLQGDAYNGSLDQATNADKSIRGGNLLAQWKKKLAGGSNIQWQFYYDRTKRNYPGTFAETLDTLDIDFQHQWQPQGKHNIVWGGGYRYMIDHVQNSAGLAFLPGHRNLRLFNIFLQDNVDLTDHLQLILGLKLEHNSYTGWEYLPNARMSLKLSHNQLVWGAISRSVRTPARIDRDFFIPGHAPFRLAGGPDFQSEIVMAHELGYRVVPNNKVSFSASTYYNRHHKLRSVERSSPGATSFFIGNKMEGETYGLELWGTYRVNDRWQLHAGYNRIYQRLRLASDSLDPTGASVAGNDPGHQLLLRSSFDLSKNLELDALLRHVGALPNPYIPGYNSLDVRLGWKFDKNAEFSLVAQNLLSGDHREFSGDSSEIERSIFAKIVWKF